MVGEQGVILGINKYPTRRCWGGRSILASLSNSTQPFSTIRPRSGVMIPAMHLRVMLLP